LRQGLNDGPTVAYDLDSDRFYYAGLTGSGICLSSATATDPLAIDRSYFFTADQVKQSFNLDQPHLVVSGNKVAITVLGSQRQTGPLSSNTLVVALADVVAGGAVHIAVIQHAGVVTPSVTVGGGNPIAWVNSGVGNGRLTIGLITGVPGQNGGITTTSSSVDLKGTSAGGFPVAMPGGSVDPRDHFIYGGSETAVLTAQGDLFVTTRVDNKFGHQLEVDHVYYVSPNFAPTVGQRALVPLPPGGDEFLCESLGVTPAGNAVVGFSSSGAGLNLTPFVVVWANHGTASGPIPVSANEVVGNTGTQRIDFCPYGAAFPDSPLLHPGEWYAGVGLTANVTGAADNSFEDGRESVFLRDGMMTGGN
jgi:hypothetical protein